jgi:hypothetical protein
MVSNMSMPFPPRVVDDESCNAVNVQPDHDHRWRYNEVVTVEDYLHDGPRSGGFLILGGMRSGIARCGENLTTVISSPRSRSVDSQNLDEDEFLLVGRSLPDMDSERNASGLLMRGEGGLLHLEDST